MPKAKRTPEKKPFVLTPATYFSKDRPHVSVSMLNDYLKSPEYYFKKHVEKSIERKPATSPMKVGSCVDAFLTNPRASKTFEAKFERTCYAKDDREQYDLETRIIEGQKAQIPEDNLLTDAEWLKATQLVEFIKSQPFWQDGLKKAVFQLPMESNVRVEGTNKTMLICGLPDRLDWENEGSENAVLNIRDLKISSFIKTSTPAKWFYSAKEMGYIRQFAMYRLLACATFGIKPEQVKCSHMVGIWHDDSLVDVQLYTFPDHEIDRAHGEIVYAMRQIIEGNFARKVIGWENAVDLSKIAAVSKLEEFVADDDEDNDSGL